eukprot:CAMPEP_0117667932 /NCGR_PEP_ID=MMETSP0804-20121206/11248_1 /TAXON_ID=1074897 /ORGANISM="Tetraselmis astigmatica, Strain CCMP880" /LENGTH=739 /DNA_ID=CAMNT_0005475727 /DNA_START=604 /DNA_END=2823 /DNA_ORIENTATION=-
MAANALKGPPIVEGDVFRGGDVVNQMINERYMQLYDSCIIQHKSKQNMMDNQKGKAFNLDGTCTVSIVYQEEMMLRPKGTGTVQALVMSNYEKRTLHVFTIRWVLSQHSFSAADHLLLGFATSSEANKWRDAVQKCVELLPAKKLPRDGGAVEGIERRNSVASSDFSTVAASLARPSTPATPTTAGTPSVPRSETSPAALPAASQPAPRTKQRYQPTPLDPEWMQKGNWPTKWVSNSFHNGIAVYREEEKDGGAYMCHTVIRAPPEQVFNSLFKFEVGGAMSNVTVLETYKNQQTQVIHCELPAKGLLAPLFGKRDTVYERTWRAEEDGSYVVTMSSVEHPLCPPPKPKSGLGWFTSAVRAEVIAMGFTISPLKSEFLPPGADPGHSPESLLMAVLRLDAGGAVGWFGAAVSRQLEDMWMWPLVTGVAGIRERMEQRRFVGTSLLMEETESPAAERKRESDVGTEAKPVPEKEGDSSEKSTVSPSPGDEKDPFDYIMNRRYWNCPGIADFKVRGPNYLVDRKKQISEEPAFELIALFLLKLDDATENVAQYLLKPSMLGFTFVVNIMVPGNDHLVMFWQDSKATALKEEDDGPTTPFNASLQRFLFGDGSTFDAQRNGTFKLIPHVVEGSWVIKQSVGATPVLLGNKLRQAYHRGPNYFEVDIDIGSSRAARSVVGLVAGTTKTVVVDMGILMEGHRDDELPERLLGTVQLDRIDMEKATRLTRQELEDLKASFKQTSE